MRLEDIKVSFGGKTVLNVPRLEIKKGKLVALLGANGSGKSTLLRVMAKIVTPEQGAVIDAGRLSLMPQKPYPFRKTVLQNVLLGSDASKESLAQARQLLSYMGMLALSEQNARGLSGGECQRMALCRHLLEGHDFLLLDEPTSAMDPAGTRLAEEAIREYCRQRKAGAVFATHAPAQAGRLADEIIFLQEGIIIEQGPAQRLLKAPESRQLAEFLKYWQI